MPSHLNCLGFDICSLEEFRDLICMTSKNSLSLSTSAGMYLPWRLGNGIELWAQADIEGVLVGLNPHYRGKTSQILGLTNKYPSAEMPLNGAFKAWANPGVDETEDPPYVGGDFPFVFDCPAFDWFQNFSLPIVARVQLVAFAKKLEVFENDRHQPPELGEAQWDEEFFIPVGTFREARDETPEAFALFGGSLLSSQTLENPLTRKPFTLATLRTYGMDIDILIPQKLVTGPLTPGQIISGEFWISGVIEEIIDSFEPQQAIDNQRLLFQSEVARTQYQENIEEAAKGLTFGSRLQLIRETHNPQDSNAIAVLTPDGIKLGYIPQETNKELAGLMDAGLQPIACLVDKREVPQPRLILRVYLPEEVPASQ